MVLLRNKMPCRNCQERHEACHDKCERYQEVKRQSDELNRQIAEAREIDRLNRRSKMTGESLRRKFKENKRR